MFVTVLILVSVSAAIAASKAKPTLVPVKAGKGNK